MEERDMKESCVDVPIGNTFEWDKLIVEVREADTCANCSFWVPDSGCYFGPNIENTPLCDDAMRKDGKSVIFVKVDEVQD